MTSYRLGYRYTTRSGVVIETWQHPGETDAEFYARFDHAVATEQPPVALIQYIEE